MEGTIEVFMTYISRETAHRLAHQDDRPELLYPPYEVRTGDTMV